MNNEEFRNDRSYHRYLILEILTNPARATHKKPTNILRKNTLPISLFTDCSLQIKFLPFLKSWPATIYWGKKDDKLGNKTRLKIERKIEIYICKSISKFWLKCMHQKQK